MKINNEMWEKAINNVKEMREKAVEYLKNIKRYDIGEMLTENAKLKQQLAITEKALELACERVKYFEEMQDREMGHFEFFGYENEYDLQAIVKNYIDKAKEMKSD